MNNLESILKYNKKFVEEKKYEQFSTSKFPNKHLAIVTCMDTRLIELLPKALGLRNGDAKIIKNAGGIITHAYGSVMRSLTIAVHKIKVEEILIIGHYSCGVENLKTEELVEQMKNNKIGQDQIDLAKKQLEDNDMSLEAWLDGFQSVEEQVKYSVNMVKSHPLIPDYVKVSGLVINPDTGELKLIC